MGFPKGIPFGRGSRGQSPLAGSGAEPREEVSSHMKLVLGCMRRADEDFLMINEGDKVCVGVSGGKDSLVLLYGLSLYRHFCKNSFVRVWTAFIFTSIILSSSSRLVSWNFPKTPNPALFTTTSTFTRLTSSKSLRHSSVLDKS